MADHKRKHHWRIAHAQLIQLCHFLCLLRVPLRTALLDPLELIDALRNEPVVLSEVGPLILEKNNINIGVWCKRHPQLS